ncbi:YybH family protein [Pandoraea anhela]|nr:nuclear transport factor 2 family protein [Pandoraea anhela]
MMHAGASFAATWSSDDEQRVRSLFLTQVAAENAHDIAALDTVLADGDAQRPSPVSFVARAYRFWGKDAVMQHFREAFAGTWHLAPDERQIRVIPLSDDTAQIYAPTQVTLGAPGKPAVTAPFLINQFAVRTPQGWKFTAILPVPAQ